MTWAFVLTAAIPTIAVLIGIMVDNGRFNDLSKRMDDLNNGLSKRMDDLANNMIQHRSQIHSDIQLLISWDREREKGGPE